MTSTDRYYAWPAEPGSRACEFCDEPNVGAVALRPGKMYVYYCEAHRTLADEARTAVEKKKAERAPKFDQGEDRLFDPGPDPIPF